MQIISANCEYIDKNTMTPYQFIELIGRTCYKSESLITEESAEKFVKNLVKRGHLAMLEHYTVIVKMPSYIATLITLTENPDIFKYLTFSIQEHAHDSSYVVGNLRAFHDIIESVKAGQLNRSPLPSRTCMFALCDTVAKLFPEIFDYEAPKNVYIQSEMKIVTESEFIREMETNKTENFNDEIMKIVTHTAKFVCDRGVSHELVRHRPAAFAQESTRYCCYSKDRFGGELTFVKPLFYTEDRKKEYEVWEKTMQSAENAYLDLIEESSSSQEARSVLPNSLKTELIMTCTEKEWQHVINLRYIGTTGAPHPQAREIMELWLPILEKTFKR